MKKLKPSSFIYQFDSIGTVRVFVREDGSMFTLQDNQVANLELALVLESGESKMWEMNINDHEELKKEDSLNETQISIMMLLKTLHDAYYSSLKPQHPVELF